MSDELVKMIREQWFALAGKYSADAGLHQRLFSGIELAYGSGGRHYHNTIHIDALLYLSNQYQDCLADKDTVDFAIFYHDIVYRITRSDNEEKSAALANKQLTELKLPTDKIKSIVHYIKATKFHDMMDANNESDLAWFLDFDMSILGAEWDRYLEYTRQVRREYAIYPDFFYNQGRRKFIQKSLSAPNIFHTHLFRTYHEQVARENLRRELEGL